MTIRVLVVDDHQVVREGFCSLLEKQSDIEVVGQAGEGRTAIQMNRELLPHVILMDITMPDMNGIEAAHQIHNEFPDTKIIILSIHSNKEYVEKALKSGVRGYLQKDCAFDELVTAIRTVISNRIYLSSDITDVVVEDYLNQRKSTEKKEVSSDILTSREREVLQLIAEGHSSKEIADKLTVSVTTIDTHRKKIMDKLNIHNLAHLVKYAIRQGLTDLDH
jgi:two-component system response regulator NreC